MGELQVGHEQTYKLSERMAHNYGVDKDVLIDVLRNNIISVGNGPAASNAELFHVMTVMNKYQLDPWMKQLWAFRHQGKLHVAVGFDGWVAQANRRKDFLGVAYEYPPMDQMVKTKGGKMCWPWVRAVCSIQGRNNTDIIAFLDEWYVPGTRGPSNWDKYPTHRLRQKAYTMSVREALGISLFDEEDYAQLRNEAPEIHVATQTDMKTDALKNALAASDEPKEETDPVDALFDEVEE